MRLKFCLSEAGILPAIGIHCQRIVGELRSCRSRETERVGRRPLCAWMRAGAGKKPVRGADY